MGYYGVQTYTVSTYWYCPQNAALQLCINSKPLDNQSTDTWARAPKNGPEAAHVLSYVLGFSGNNYTPTNHYN